MAYIVVKPGRPNLCHVGDAPSVLLGLAAGNSYFAAHVVHLCAARIATARPMIISDSSIFFTEFMRHEKRLDL
jgi:hypothetical protein